MKSKPTSKPKAGHILRLAALLLCVALLSACSFPFDFDKTFDLGGSSGAQAEQPSRERRTIAYGDMVYQRPDVEGMKTRVAELTDQLRDAASFDEAMTIDGEVEELFENFSTMQTLAFLATRLDVNDAAMDEEYRYLNEQGVELTLLGNEFNEVLVYGPWADDYKARVGDYVFASIENSLLLSNDAVADYKKERSALEVDYDQWYSTLSVSHNGESYTFDDILELESSSLQSQLYTEYTATYRDQYAEMLYRMVELDSLTAYTLGFASAPDMYYLAYDRDYTPDDARQLCEYSRYYFVPMLDDVYYYTPGAMDLDDTFAQLPSALSQLTPELAEVWDAMLQYGLYDCEPRAGKSTSSQFTTNISAYDAPYLYTYWRDDFSSVTTLVHEFGHFYDFWLHYEDSSTSLDLAEVYSQGLELLMYPLYDNLVDYAEEAELDNLSSMLENVLVFQCALEDFQLRLYELDTFDADIVGMLYTQVLYDYGLIPYTPQQIGPLDDWLRISHIFSSPFYTISYVTSAIAALQIWAVAQEDWDAGVQVYLDMIHSNQEQPFGQLLESVGLAPVHRRSTLQEIATQLGDALGAA